MDYVSTNFVAIIGAAALFVIYNLWRNKINTTTKSLPPQVSGALPLIGHLHRLRGKRPLARILGSLADKYGSIFMIKLGMHRTVVISNNKIMKEFYTTNDKFFASRPRSTMNQIVSFNYANFSFSPYGSYWRGIKKLTITDLLSPHRIALMKHVQSSEVSHTMKELSLKCKEDNNGPTKVDLSELFECMAMNMMTRMIIGKRCSGQHVDQVNGTTGRGIQEITKDFMAVIGAFVPSDMIPFLGWTENFGTVKSCKRIVKEFDDLMEIWIQEHESNGNTSENKYFIDALLSNIEDDNEFGNSRRTIIKTTILTLILGGSDTTSITMTWLVACLLNNKRVLSLAQEEIDQKVGRERKVEDSDIEKLVYLNAIIKEILRLYPAGPLAVPREAMEDCTLYGYHIPKGTRILTNLWKLHRDPDVWQNPDEFQPERFLTNHVNVEYTGQHFEFVPFGSGRRKCPGYNFAMQVTQLTIARFLQGFTIKTPNNERIDMTESFNLTLSMETPLEVMITPRLLPQLYE